MRRFFAVVLIMLLPAWASAALPASGAAAPAIGAQPNPQALDEYAGSYRLAPGFVLKVFRHGDQLYAQATGQGAAPIYESAKDQFFYKVVNAQLTFERDAAGKVTGLVLHQNGDHPAPRMATTVSAATASATA